MYLKNTFSFAQIAFRKAARLFAGSYIVLFIALGGGLLSVRATQSRVYRLEEETYGDVLREFSILKGKFKSELEKLKCIKELMQKVDASLAEEVLAAKAKSLNVDESDISDIKNFLNRKKYNLNNLRYEYFQKIWGEWESEYDNLSFLYDFFEKGIEGKKPQKDEFDLFLKEYEMIKNMTNQLKESLDTRADKAKKILDEGHAELLKALGVEEFEGLKKKEIYSAIQKEINALQISDETYLKDFNKLKNEEKNIIDKVREKYMIPDLKAVKEVKNVIAELKRGPKGNKVKAQRSILELMYKEFKLYADVNQSYLYDKGEEVPVLKEKSDPEEVEKIKRKLEYYYMVWTHLVEVEGLRIAQLELFFRYKKSDYLQKKLKELSVRQEKASQKLEGSFKNHNEKEIVQGMLESVLNLNKDEVNEKVEKLIQEVVDTEALTKRALSSQVSRWSSISFGVGALGGTFVGAAAVLCYVYFTQKGKEHKKEENEEKKEEK